MFAALILDRDPYTFADFPGLAQAWLQDAGGFLFVGLLFYLLISLTRPHAVPNADAAKRGVPPLAVGCAAAATLLYAGYGLLVFANLDKGPLAFGTDLLNVKPPPDPNGYVKTVPPRFSLYGYTHADLPAFMQRVVPLYPPEQRFKYYPWHALLLTLGGLAAFVGATAPAFGGLLKLRGRRVWAVAVLAVKEVVRNWVFVAFLFVFAVLLFPINWFIPSKPENELRDAVKWLAPLTAVLLVVPGVLLASYALPNDVKNQNVYTLVTKPVERFEVVLGRFLGYTLLFSAVVLAVGLVTLLTTFTSNPSELAKKETMTARVPTRGKLAFLSSKGLGEGTDVGKEFNYRKYIGGSPTTSERAVYSFAALPGGLKGMAQVPVEFTFDIYRLTKGEENKGVQVDVRVTTWQCPQKSPTAGVQRVGFGKGEWEWAEDADRTAYRKDALDALRRLPGYTGLADEGQAANALAVATPGSPEWAVANDLARKYGYFEYKGKEVFDFHPERLDLPPGLFENAAGTAAGGKAFKPGTPRLVVAVQCTSASQMLGMAEGDLYLMEDPQPFWWNHLKASFGLWCWLVLVVGLAVCLSTYLDFLVTLLLTGGLFVAAFFGGFIYELGQTIGKGLAGPFASLNQLLQAKQSTALPEGTALEKTAETGDVGFAWALRRLLNVLPDVDSFNWTNYVAEGFDVPFECLVMNFVVLAAYLFPWLLLAYYLIRGREVAA